jgi:ComF family protein
MHQLACIECRKPALWGETHLRCKRKYSLDGLLSSYVYAGLMKVAVSRFKYRLVSDLTETLLELLVSQADAPPLFGKPFTLVPVPLSLRRKRWRGFNQAQLLAEGLHRAWEWPYEPHLLSRVRDTKPQMSLSSKDRKANVVGAFTLNRNCILPRRVLLVDDVVTTGATMRECGKVLKRAGVETVWGLSLAQTDRG